MITVPALATSAAHLSDRLVQGLDPASSSSQFLAITRDQEQAVISPGPEQNHNHEHVGDVDDLKSEARHLGQQRDPLE